MTGVKRLLPIIPVALLALGSGPGATVLQNERNTLDDIQAVSSAMAAYGSENQGFFDWPRCLVDPPSCLPGYEGPPMMARELASLAPRHGYRRAFHLGPPAPRTGYVRSPTSIISFAYTAVPLQVGRTGNRAFCVDASGYVRESEYGASSLVTADGRCTPGRMAEEPPPRSIEEIEARVIADLRRLTSGEQAYQSANAGFYDWPQCLGAPSGCLRDYSTELSFLDPRIADLRERHGYRRRFHPGPQPPAEQVGAYSPSSLTAWAYTAVPVVPGRTGRRAFCVDERGWICAYARGTEPALVNGQCEACSTPL